MLFDVFQDSKGSLYVETFVGRWSEKFRLQLNTFNKVVSVVSTECPDYKCIVTNKFDQSISTTAETVTALRSSYDHLNYHGFNDEGFWTFGIQGLQGNMIADDVRFVMDNRAASKDQILIFENVITTFNSWESDTDGILGLAPYTVNNLYPRTAESYNFIKQLNDLQTIQN